MAIIGLSTSTFAASIMDYVKQASEKGSKIFCRKGDSVNIVSVRSGKGILCKNKLLGALAVYTCLDGNVEEFSESGCFNNAKEAMKNDLEDKEELTTAKAKAILFAEGKKAGGQVFELIKGLISKK